MVFETRVTSEWVDYNGHMNDAAYAKVFSSAANHFIHQLGLDDDVLKQQQYSVYTLENHICYLGEAFQGETLRVSKQLLDHDEKRLHVFFMMENEEQKRLATSEQMLMGMDLNEGRPAPFPNPIQSRIDVLAAQDKDQPTPSEAGRTIGIRKKR